MNETNQTIPVTFQLAVRMQFFQACLLLAFSALGVFLSIWGPERGTTHGQRVFNSIACLLLPGLAALSIGILLRAKTKIGWQLSVAWNFIAFYGTAAAFLPYFWALFLVVIVSPSLAIGCLLTRSTRTFIVGPRQIQATQN